MQELANRVPVAAAAHRADTATAPVADGTPPFQAPAVLARTLHTVLDPVLRVANTPVFFSSVPFHERKTGIEPA